MTLVLRSTPARRFVFWLILAALSVWVWGELLFLAISVAWLGVQFKLQFKPSCCRTTGGVAVLLGLLAIAIAPGPGRLATPFFELPLCHNTSGGASALYGLLPAGAAAANGGGSSNLHGTCSPSAAQPFEVPLASGTLDGDRAYRPVMLLPAGSHASLILSVLDDAGRVLYTPTKLELDL